MCSGVFIFKAEDGIRDLVRSRGLGDVYKRQNDLYSKGCHALIKQNKAMIFESAADIADAMNWNQKEKPTLNKQMMLFEDYLPEEQIIIKALNQKNLLSIDEIALTSLMPVSKVSSILLKLEFAGILIPLPGKVFKLNN